MNQRIINKLPLPAYIIIILIFYYFKIKHIPVFAERYGIELIMKYSIYSVNSETDVPQER